MREVTSCTICSISELSAWRDKIGRGKSVAAEVALRDLAVLVILP
jgi:hypothetical protein